MSNIHCIINASMSPTCPEYHAPSPNRQGHHNPLPASFPAPCLPTNVKTLAACTSDELITTWDSAAGALSYFVEAQGNTGSTRNCSSASNSCVVRGVPCGQHLTVWIVASNDNCSTSRVLGEVAETGERWKICSGNSKKKALVLVLRGVHLYLSKGNSALQLQLLNVLLKGTSTGS